MFCATIHHPLSAPQQLPHQFSPSLYYVNSRAAHFGLWLKQIGDFKILCSVVGKEEVSTVFLSFASLLTCWKLLCFWQRVLQPEWALVHPDPTDGEKMCVRYMAWSSPSQQGLSAPCNHAPSISHGLGEPVKLGWSPSCMSCSFIVCLGLFALTLSPLMKFCFLFVFIWDCLQHA